MRQIANKRSVADQLQHLAVKAPRLYYRWAEHALPNASCYQLESSTLWMMEHQIRWKILQDKKRWFLRSKRLFDLLLALFLLPALAVITLLVGVALKISHPHQPIFFYQLRTGRQTQPFWMIKFRTANPHGARLNHFIHQTSGSNSRQALSKISYLLRRFSIDELPQILNVLKGDMSFVGPRPLSADDTLFVQEHYYERFAALPGMTGLWQCQIPIVTNGYEKLNYDCRYVAHLGWTQEAHILLQTIRVIFYKPFAKELWA